MDRRTASIRLGSIDPHPISADRGVGALLRSGDRIVGHRRTVQETRHEMAVLSPVAERAG